MWTQCLKITKIVAFFKNSPKLTIFGIFNELLSTQNVNVARFARNIECDFFGDFQTLWRRETLVPQQFSFRANIVKIDLNYFDLLKLTTLWINCCLETDLNFKISELLKSLKWIFPSSVASTYQLHCLSINDKSYQKSQQKYLKIQKIFFTYFSIIENCYFQYSKYFWNYLFWLWNNIWHFLTLWNPIW